MANNPSDAMVSVPDASTIDAGPRVYRFGESDDVDFRAVTTDTYVSGALQGINYGSKVNLIVDETSQRSALIRFDLREMPAFSAVVDASLYIVTVPDGSSGSTSPVSVYEVLESWNELEANNIERSAGVAWATPGVGSGSRASNMAASFVPDGMAQVFVVRLSAGLIERWLGDPTTNNGLVLVPTSFNGADFESSESAATAARPVLEISVR